jgi:hypothetical protein
MNTKLTAIAVIATVTLMIATTIASMAPSAMAIRSVAQNNQASNRIAQAGLVNANVGAQANVGGVCVNVLSKC